MNWDRINRWSTAISNVALLGGLVLVAVQIRQNTAITRAQLMNDYYLADMQLELAMMGEDPAASFTRAVFDPEALTEYDAAILDRYFNYGVVQVRRLRQMYELGLAGEGWQDRIGYLRWHLGNEAGRRWWARTRGDEMGDEVIAAIDSILLDSDWNDNRELIESITRSESDPDR
jgi:hypothetical protein